MKTEIELKVTVEVDSEKNHKRPALEAAALEAVQNAIEFKGDISHYLSDETRIKLVNVKVIEKSA